MRYTDRVPYYGLVDWDRQKVTSYAEDLAVTHRPRRRWLPRRECCVACGTSWPCYAGAWAAGTIRGANR
jgi:hypothetical protein